MTAKGGTTYQNLTYGYDAGGNVTVITDPLQGTQTYGYDGLDRLTSATGPYGTQTYAYSPIGNLTQNSLLGPYSYPATATPSGRSLPHAVKNTGVGQPDFTYDDNGNLTTGAGRTLTYDLENRPTTIATGGVTTTVVYDGDGGRVQKTEAGRLVTYIGDLQVCEGTGASACCVNYLFAGGQRIAAKRTDTGAVTYFHGDHLGSTSVVTDGTGNKIEGLAYYPFGATRLNTGPLDAPYKYTDQEFDSATGLYYYKARYYDPVLGRFIQPDPIVPDLYDPQSLNPYSYVLNNPLRYIDPSGYGELSVIPSGTGDATVPFGIYGQPGPQPSPPSPVLPYGYGGLGSFINPATYNFAPGAAGSSPTFVQSFSPTISVLQQSLATPVTVQPLPPGGLEEVRQQIVQSGPVQTLGFVIGGGIRPVLRSAAISAGRLFIRSREAIARPLTRIGILKPYAMERLLRPGGQLIGEPGSDPTIRVLAGGLSAAEDLFGKLTRTGEIISDPRYPGTIVGLPGGGRIGLRPESESGGPAIDVHHVPGFEDLFKIHFR